MEKPRSRALQGQVAVVTGGGRGIGRAIAQGLAAAGAEVGVVARTRNELAETVALVAAAGGRAMACRADVADSGEVQAAMREIEKSLGPIDLLVNNAGAPGPAGPFWENNFNDWWRAIEVNLRGPALCTAAIMPGMISRRRGRIINIVSGAATFPIAYMSSYVTGKTALARFTENLAMESKPYNIAVFCVAPGTVRTAMSEHVLESPEGKKWFPWFRRIMDEGLDVPAERPAELVVTLASGKADALSGRYLSALDNLESLLGQSEEIAKGEMLALRVRRPPGEEANPALAAIRAAAGRGGE